MSTIMSLPSPARDDQLIIGSSLTSSSSSYLLESILGQGAFGIVARCTRKSDMQEVAIKMIKNKDPYIQSAQAEVSILLKLKSLDPDKCSIVRWYHAFIDRGHAYLEFEQLDKNLLDLLGERAFRPFLLKEIRPVVQQLANALCHLKAVGIIHADLKMENVMLVNHAHEPFRVKLIDFGLACETSAAVILSCVQTLPYRAPEIILGLPFTEAIDIWSLGCLAATMYLSSLLYPGISEYDMIRYVVDTQGPIPDHLLSAGQRTCNFFQRCNDSNRHWKLKSPELFRTETGIQPMETRHIRLRSLDDLLHIRRTETQAYACRIAEKSDTLMFVDMLMGMLQLDAAQRFTPKQVMEHPFTTMDHIVCMRHLSSYVRSCFELMNVCHKTQTSGSGRAVGGSSQQPSSSIVHPVQHRRDKESSSSSSSIQDENQTRPSVIRKVADHVDVWRERREN